MIINIQNEAQQIEFIIDGLYIDILRVQIVLKAVLFFEILINLYLVLRKRCILALYIFDTFTIFFFLLPFFFFAKVWGQNCNVPTPPSPCITGSVTETGQHSNGRCRLFQNLQINIYLTLTPQKEMLGFKKNFF